MKKFILTILFCFMFCPLVSSAYLGQYNNTQFYVDEQQYTEHDGVIETVLITIDNTSTMRSKTTIDTNNNKFCMYDNLVIENNKQEQYTSSKWYLYNKYTFIQKAVDYLHRENNQ